jgi:aminoglycoside 3-N-acetyltransferase
MHDPILFTPADAPPVTTASLARDLLTVKATECDVLFVHTGLHLGAPNPALGRRGLMEELHRAFTGLGVANLMVPTFTFSFCNGQDYDVDKSPTRMGAYNEFFRKQPGVERSVDPLMSCALLGPETGLIRSIGKYSCGPDSTYDLLHRRGAGVRFLFLGVRAYECFTYTHYVESVAQVPFRYHRPFSGRITAAGRTWEDTYHHYARYHGTLATLEDGFERYLETTRRIQKMPLGDGWLSTVTEPNGFAAMSECLAQNPFFLARRTYAPEEMRDTRYEESDVVAL